MENYAINISRVVSLLSSFDLEGAHRTDGSQLQRPINFSASDAGHAHFVEVQGVWFSIWDNGGEIGVERLNSGELPRMVAARFYARGENQPNDSTLAMWVASAITGDSVDYDQEMTAEDHGILLSC